jgi:hypothetical protein
MTSSVWIFHSSAKRWPNFAGAVFSNRPTAEEWIRAHSCSGTLTEYPLDVGVYDWAIENNRFTPKKPEHYTPEFVGGFTTASQDHHHYENGERLS